MPRTKMPRTTVKLGEEEAKADLFINWAKESVYRTYPLVNDNGVAPIAQRYDVPAIHLAEQVVQGIATLLRNGYMLEIMRATQADGSKYEVVHLRRQDFPKDILAIIMAP